MYKISEMLMSSFKIFQTILVLWIKQNTRITDLNRGRTDRISLTHDLDLQSSASYGHELLVCKSSKLTSSQSGNKRMDGQMDGRTEAIAVHPTLIWQVNILWHDLILISTHQIMIIKFRNHRLITWLIIMQSVPNYWVKNSSPTKNAIFDITMSF